MKKNSTVGRRKTSVARVFIKKGKGTVMVNGKELAEYFPLKYMQDNALSPLRLTETASNFDFKINVQGGGVKGQVEAIRLGIARALVVENEELKPTLKKARLLTRDARVVERKKTGLRKARKQEQFSKR